MRHLEETARVVDPVAPQVLAVEGLVKTYGRRGKEPVVAVSDVGFEVRRGEVVGLLGPNGAGKTTTIKCICGLIKPDSGRIFIDGVDAIAHQRQSLRKVAAVLEGNRNLYWRLTAVENIFFFAGINGLSRQRVAPRVEELLTRLHLEDKRNEEVRKLSRGMQQKLAVACAFIKDTPLLFLDEPTLGLDVETSHELRVDLKQMAAEEGRTIVLSSHDMDVVQSVCDRVIIVSQGRVLADDTVANLLSLFRTRTYRFVLTEPLSPDASRAVRARFHDATVVSDTIELSFTTPSDLYVLVDLLRNAAAQVAEIDRQEVDLEEVFLSLIRSDNGK